MFNYWHNYRYYFKIFNRLLSLDKGNAKCFSLNKSAILNILWKQNVFYFFHQFIGFNPGGNTESLSGPFPSIPTSKGSGTVDWGMSIENLTAWKMNALSFVLSQMNPRQPTYQNRSRMANPEKQSLASKWTSTFEVLEIRLKSTHSKASITFKIFQTMTFLLQSFSP